MLLDLAAMVCLLAAPALLLLPAFVYLLLKFIICPATEHLCLEEKHVLITGGSKGIGRALAECAAKRGARVTIVARNAAQLADAAQRINGAVGAGGDRRVCAWVACDVTGSYEQISEAVDKAEEQFGPVDVLINNAGATGYQGRLEDMPTDNVEKVLRLNVTAAAHFARRCVPAMRSGRRGAVAFVSSAAGQIGIWGFGAYSASKFALRGLAEALQMELRPYGVRCTVVYPPNTMTEGFQEELRSMPAEVEAISGTAGLFDARDVANKALDAIQAGHFCCGYGVDGWMLAVTCAGAAPEPNPAAALQQIFLSGPLRLVGLCYHKHFALLVDKLARRRETAQRRRQSAD